MSVSDSIQSHTAPLQFSLFSTAALPTQRGQEMPTREFHSVITEPSRQTVTCTPGEYARVSDNAVSVTTSILPKGIDSRDNSCFSTISTISSINVTQNVVTTMSHMIIIKNYFL